MKPHTKKMIAPILIAVLIILYYVIIAGVFILIEGIPMWGKLLLIIVPLALAGVMAGVLKSRIDEIRSGEEDDLSKY